MIRRLVLLALLAPLFAVLAAGCTEEPAALPTTTRSDPVPSPLGDPDWRAVIDDWYDDGMFEEQHDCAAVSAMSDLLPTGGRDYSSVHDDFEAYNDLVCTDARRPSAPVTVVHRFVHPLPYPAGPRYTVSLRRAGAFRGVRWARFANDASYARSGVEGEARFASVLLPSRRYVVTSSMNTCDDANDGCTTMGKPQARCARSFEVTDDRRVGIKIIARSGQACEISIDR